MISADVPRRCPRIPTGVLPALLILAISAAAHPALANPVPDCAMLTHVQPIDPDFCATSPIRECSQIVQLTTADGLLEFDLFLFTPGWGEELPVHSLQGTCEWTENWQLIEYEICHDGEGTVAVEGHRAELDIAWPHCPQMSGQLFLAARFVMDVSGFGWLGMSVADTEIELFCPPDQTTLWPPVATPAQAGVECSYCEMPCNLDAPCNPQLVPVRLILETIAGEAAHGIVTALVSGGDEINPCPVDFTAGEYWLELDVLPLSWQEYEIDVTADASTLEPGEYRAWIRGASACQGCTRVELTVLASQGIPEDGGNPHDRDRDPASAVSWGKLKTIYR